MSSSQVADRSVVYSTDGTDEVIPCSGWPPNSSETRDFHHRPRFFPAEVKDWREHMVKRVRGERETFQVVKPSLKVTEVRSLIDDGISHLREVARILAVVHGNPRLGNKQDPIDELVYIILSRKTREKAYQETFELLKSRFDSWDELLTVGPAVVEKLVRGGGLSEKKTESLFGALAIIQERFGSCTLEPARDWDDDELESFLCSLPEIQKKSAYCIMMYTMGRMVFPVDTHVGRILARIGIYRELGLDLDGLDHKKLQKVLADLIPPNLRYSLHVNLVAHGREVCPATTPHCERCEVRGFCRTFRAMEFERLKDNNRGTFVDLFCGAGGVTEGFEQAGFRPLLALDMDPIALRTYRLNHPSIPDDRIVCADISTLAPGHVRRKLGKEKVDILVGAPPCQGYSSVGNRSKSAMKGNRTRKDSRNYLYEFMVEMAIELKPALFLMENVPGMKSARRVTTSFMDHAAELLQEQGYRTDIWKLNAAAFGVAQDRVRYFLVASRGDMLPCRPEQEYRDLLQKTVDIEALEPVTLDEAIYDLPPLGADDGAPVMRFSGTRDDDVSDMRGRRYLRKFRIWRDPTLLYNHTVRFHNENDLELYALLKPGENSVHAVEVHGREDLMKYRKDVFDDKYNRLRGDRPSRTIVAHLAKDGNGYIHPTQVRSISFREAARAQSFHDRYAFCGSPSDQWVHLGNAVPPLLARAVADSFAPAIPEGE